MIDKAHLTEKYRGGTKGPARRGTLVRVTRDVPMGGVPYGTMPGESPRWVLRAGVYEVADLMDRPRFNKPDRIGILRQPGLVCSVQLADLDLAS